MDMKRFGKFGAAVALGTMMMVSAAVADEGRFYVVPGLQWMDFDSERQLEDDWGLSFGFGYGLTDNLNIELSGTRITADRRNGGEDRLRQFRLDMLYTLDNNIGSVSPYFVGGVGDNSFRVNRNETLLNLGAGLSYRFNDRVSWRTGARTFFGIDDSTYDFGIDTGLVFRLGPAPVQERVEPTPPPPPPVAEPEPIIIEEVARIELAVQFEFDRSFVDPQYYEDIRRVADFLAEHSDVIADVEGHTCNIGTAEYNQGLSERRANAVRDVLINEFGVAPNRVRAAGYGESQPIASNNTREGRERNRRVESVMSTVVQRELQPDEL